jgi:starch synthase
MSKILMVSSEAAPFAKTGGLSDVLGALPSALRKAGHDVHVLLPRFASAKTFPMRRIWGELRVPLGPREYVCGVFQSEQDPAFLFLDYPEFYDRKGLYNDVHGDYWDNHLRFGLLSRAALEVVRKIFPARILHCHDWQSGLVPVYLNQMAGDPTFAGIKTILTIHNLGYPGIFGRHVMGELGLPNALFGPSGVEFYGNVSFLKAGLRYAGTLTTVSRKYAEEIKTPEYGFGLDGLLRYRSNDLHGILNGIDYTRWNPETDSLIPANYSASDLTGKQICKQALQQEFGLTVSGTPLIGIVSRFTGQKGSDLIAAIGDRLFSSDVNLVALGSGEPQYEAMFTSLAARFPGRVAVRIGFDEALAHRIEAGSDMFLMPSRYEPCGLNQIYSLRYGTVPIVRATGGLDDTVDQTNGFKFHDYHPDALLGCLQQALAAFGDCGRWKGLMLAGMARDFSWDASAQEYSQLYERLLNPTGR